jgi:hypothetical protein
VRTSCAGLRSDRGRWSCLISTAAPTWSPRFTGVVGLVELMAGYSIEDLAVMTGHDRLFLKAVYAVYHGSR